jgi:hypothetical protein
LSFTVKNADNFFGKDDDQHEQEKPEGNRDPLGGKSIPDTAVFLSIAVARPYFWDAIVWVAGANGQIMIHRISATITAMAIAAR